MIQGRDAQPIKKATSQPPRTDDRVPRATIRAPCHDPIDPIIRACPRIASLASSSPCSTTACGATHALGQPVGGPHAEPGHIDHRTAIRAPSGSASAGASTGADAIYDAVESQVVAIRGLQPKRAVARQLIDEAELRTMLTTEFDKETPPAYLAANERLYKALGLIPADANLRTLSLDLLSGGVAAFYRNDEGKLYVVSKTGAARPDRAVLLRARVRPRTPGPELDGLQGLDKVYDQSDKLLARQSIYEGDATLLMTQWAAANLSQADLVALLASGTDPAAQAVLARTPAILSETLTFPYTTGFAYVTGGSRAPAAGRRSTPSSPRCPKSTEQILHPEKYAAGEAPVAVTLPADLATRLGAGWTRPAAGHLRGAPARDLAARGRRGRRGHEGSGRLGRRSAGRAAGPERRVGGGHADRLGHRSRRGGVRGRRHDRAGKAGGSARSSPARAARRVGSSSRPAMAATLLPGHRRARAGGLTARGRRTEARRCSAPLDDRR